MEREMASPATGTEALSDGPVLNLMSKRLRALRKKYNRITQMEERLAQGKPLNPEQDEVLRSKPAVAALIDEYEKLRAPLSIAVQEELSLLAASPSPPPAEDSSPSHHEEVAVEDLVGLLYFGRLFDVMPPSEFTATMLTRTHERGCCLTYDYVTDEATELLGERDLDAISDLGSLVTSRPASSGVSHKNALQGCVHYARLWLQNSDVPINQGSSVTYAGLREKLKKIMASDYFTTTPEMKAPVDVAAAVGKYNTVCQVQVPESTEDPEPAEQIDDAPDHYQHKDVQEDFQETEVFSDPPSPVDEPPKDEADLLDPSGEITSAQQEPQKPEAGMEEHNLRDSEQKEQQYNPSRPYQNQRGGGRGGGGFGGRRGYPNGRGGRGGRGVGGGYQNGRSQYHDAGYYPRNYYNTRGRGGRAGGSGMYSNHGAAAHGGLVAANAE